MLADHPSALVIDAGPLIGLLNTRDDYHADALQGFESLSAAGVALRVPSPIIFEVYKWLLHRTGLPTAQLALALMLEDLRLEYIDERDLHGMRQLMAQRPTWTGSLEDASVVWLASRTGAPIWTNDYRDFAAFKNIEFWTPG